MRSVELDAAVERLLLRVVPDLARDWAGASQPEIDRLERLAGAPLAEAHRWFLARMGRAMGRLEHPRWDFGVSALIQSYESGHIVPRDGFVLVGRERPALEMENNLFMNVSKLREGDGELVLLWPEEQGVGDRMYGSLRETLAYFAVWAFGVEPKPAQAHGTLRTDESDISTVLRTAFAELGFVAELPAGPTFGVFERPDAAVVLWISPGRAGAGVMRFHVGASTEAEVRRVMGHLSLSAGVAINLDLAT